MSSVFSSSIFVSFTHSIFQNFLTKKGVCRSQFSFLDPLNMLSRMNKLGFLYYWIINFIYLVREIRKHHQEDVEKDQESSRWKKIWRAIARKAKRKKNWSKSLKKNLTTPLWQLREDTDSFSFYKMYFNRQIFKAGPIWDFFGAPSYDGVKELFCLNLS